MDQTGGGEPHVTGNTPQDLDGARPLPVDAIEPTPADFAAFLNALTPHLDRLFPLVPPEGVAAGIRAVLKGRQAGVRPGSQE